MKNEVNLLKQQIIAFIVLLFYFLFFGEPLALFVGLGALVMVLLFIFRIKKYNPKIYYLVPFPIFVFQGLILVYTYLFRLTSPQNPFYIVLFYFFVVILVMVVYFYTHSYLKLYAKRSE